MDEIIIIIIIIISILFIICIIGIEAYRLWTKKRRNKPLLNEQFLNFNQLDLHQEL